MTFTKIYEEKFMRFPEGKCKAATFSYDDGVEADRRLIKVFDKYGMRATFNLNSELFDAKQWNRRMDEETVFETFAGSRHEIAMHGARHIFLDRVPLPEAINEVLKNRVYLENKFNRVVRGLAYAYGAYNGDILGAIKSLGVLYARTTKSTHNFSIPRNMLELNPTCHHNEECLLPLLDRFVNDSPLNMPKERDSWLLYIWGHSYEFDNDNNWELIEDVCDRLSQNSKDIWFATNGEICDYINAYKNLVFSLDGERCFNPSYMGVWLEIRGKIYRIGAGEEVVFDK